MIALSPKHESFARGIAAGLSKTKAYALAYGRKDNGANIRANASRLWLRLAASKQIRARVDQLMKNRRKAAELTAERNLDDMLLEADLASAAQQYSAAITARKLIGQELFGQFTNRRETINIDMDYRSIDELKADLIRDYGQEIADGIWAKWSAPKQIEHDTTDGETITDSPNDTDTERANTNSLQSLPTRPKTTQRTTQ